MPSSGQENDCSLMHYTFEGKIYELASLLIQIEENTPTIMEACEASQPSNVYQSIISERVTTSVAGMVEQNQNESCNLKKGLLMEI